MARPSRFTHPFRRVRDLMGLSQEKAAEALGISRSGLKQIETGMLPLSAEISGRMFALSGAIIPTGICNETIAPVAWDGSPYDANSLARWSKTFSNAPEKLHELMLSDLQIFMKVAGRKGYPLPFMSAIQRSVRQLAKDFRLVDFNILSQEEAARLLGYTKEDFVAINRLAGGITEEKLDVLNRLFADIMMEKLIELIEGSRQKPKKAAESKRKRP
jgi:predicted DNA-binding protein (UPF0251 family)